MHCTFCTRELVEGENPYAPDYPVQEPLVPLSQGGEWVESNLVDSCRYCSNRKYSKTLEQWLEPEQVEQVKARIAL